MRDCVATSVRAGAIVAMQHSLSDSGPDMQAEPDSLPSLDTSKSGCTHTLIKADNTCNADATSSVDDAYAAHK
jgi:hypothetical protein